MFYCILLLIFCSRSSISCNTSAVSIVCLSWDVFQCKNFAHSPRNSTFAVWSMSTWSTKALDNFSLSVCTRPLSSLSLWEDANDHLDGPIVVRLLSARRSKMNNPKRAKHPCAYYSNSSATLHCLLVGDLVFKLNPGPCNTIPSIVSTYQRNNQSHSYRLPSRNNLVTK